MPLDPFTLEVLFGLLKAGTAAAELAQRTYDLYKRGAISIEELADLWRLKVQLVQQARGDWVNAGQASQPVQAA